jgi:putative transposase
MITFLAATLTYRRAFLVARHNLGLEAAALWQQLTVYKRKQPRPKLHRFDRLFWIALRRLWTDWADALVLVKPDTVVSWHRAGFRLFWRWRSRASRAGRPKVAQEIRESIRRIRAENSTWGAPRIHGELLLLGFEISEPTVSRFSKDSRHSESTAFWRTFQMPATSCEALCSNGRLVQYGLQEMRAFAPPRSFL